MFPNIFHSVFHNPYSNHYHQVPHPHSNTSYDIPHGLAVGKQIIISATASPSCDRFQVNLDTRNGGTALHINPRFSGQFGAHTIVRNSNLGGWGAEENQGPFPLQPNVPFDLVISVEHDKYRVAINGQHAFDFHHRAPFQEVVRLGLVGDIHVSRILFAGGESHGHHHHNEVHSPHLPFATPIAGGPVPGRLIQVSGFVPHNSRRFVINLQNGTQQDPNEIPLHFSVRFDDPNGPSSVAVRTNRAYGSWGNEERDGLNPFQLGAHFDLLILIEHHEFKIAVNGSHFTSFHHRNPLAEANHVGIYGDVQIHAVKTF